jgi:hypothetical protein
MTDDWPIFPDNTDWVSPTWSSGATLQANGFESGSAAVPHWPMTVWGETLTIYINIISGQPSHHSTDDGGGDGLRNVGLLSTTDTACCLRRFYWILILATPKWEHRSYKFNSVSDSSFQAISVIDFHTRYYLLCLPLHDVHEMNAYRVCHVHVIQLVNRQMDLDEDWYGRYATGDYPEIILFNFLWSVIPTWQMNKLVRWDQH